MLTDTFGHTLVAGHSDKMKTSGIAPHEKKAERQVVAVYSSDMAGY
jgi:hypothetical protein